MVAMFMIRNKKHFSNIMLTGKPSEAKKKYMLLLNDRETVKNYFSKNGFIKCIILITEFHNIRAKNRYLHSSQRRSQH